MTSPTGREVVMAILLVVGGFVALDKIDQAEATLARYESAHAGCHPQGQHEIAVLAWQGDQLQCALHTGTGRRQTVHRFVY